MSILFNVLLLLGYFGLILAFDILLPFYQTLKALSLIKSASEFCFVTTVAIYAIYHHLCHLLSYITFAISCHVLETFCSIYSCL